MSAPLCRYCGEPIAKATRTVWLHDRPLTEHERCDGGMIFRHLFVEQLPPTIEDCRKLTNWEVLAVKRSRGTVDLFSEWDGQSYKDQYFCKADHAKRFGYAAAASGQGMPAYNKAMALKKGAA